MPKCYLHGQTAQEKPTKLKTAPSHPETNFRQDLNILLAGKPPIRDLSIQPNRYWEFDVYINKIKGLEVKNKDLISQFAAERIVYGNEITQLEIDKQFLEQKDQKKADRIAQLDYVLKGSKIIFRQQQERIEKLSQELDKETKVENSEEWKRQLEIARKKASGEISLESWENKEGLEKWLKELEDKDYQKHLQRDIKLFAEQRKELADRLKKLDEAKKESEKIRDEEINQLKADLKTEKEKLTQLIERVMNLK
ncbi:MAG: hypothetical protein I3273_05000 [Candidatus Moeniiplasma glomeromycotorum]|nr:hypothetical protein [Candidatus Moeniiplasma glomeromycotorum]MCE8167900.1 hypothetical protein [Candidatus Moeniiplasma glomeromycotorum]MCE8169450.1 hypothetical protein [Candidatus Moeniiplasma glomeromycotorum]